MSTPRNRQVLYATGALFIAALLVIGSPLPFVTIRTGEVGLVSRAGAVVRVAGPGLRLKLPFIESVQRVTTRTQRFTFPRLQGQSSEGDALDARVTLVYRIDEAKVAAVNARFGWDIVGEALAPNVVAAYRRAAATLTMEQALAVTALHDSLRDAIRAALPDGIIADAVVIDEVFADPALNELEQQRKRLSAERKIELLRAQSRYEMLVERLQVERQILLANEQHRAESERNFLIGDQARLEKELDIERRRDAARREREKLDEQIKLQQRSARDALERDRLQKLADMVKQDPTVLSIIRAENELAGN